MYEIFVWWKRKHTNNFSELRCYCREHHAPLTLNPYEPDKRCRYGDSLTRRKNWGNNSVRKNYLYTSGAEGADRKTNQS